jgi:hypothetical protein
MKSAAVTLTGSDHELFAASPDPVTTVPRPNETLLRSTSGAVAKMKFDQPPFSWSFSQAVLL